jgi:hypothetical protein
MDKAQWRLLLIPTVYQNGGMQWPSQSLPQSPHQVPSHSPNPARFRYQKPGPLPDFAQTLRPCAGPILLDVVQTRSAFHFGR